MIPAAIWIQRKIASWANRTSIINSFACGGARHLSSERPARQFPGAGTRPWKAEAPRRQCRRLARRLAAVCRQFNLSERRRHAALLQSLTQRYGITVGDGRPPAPRDAEWAFLRMGYGECFDSFFAFGLFRLSADTGLFPDALVRTFDGVMDEEARHILFFTNWVAYRRLGLPLERRAWVLVGRGLRLPLQAFGRVRKALHPR